MVLGLRTTLHRHQDSPHLLNSSGHLSHPTGENYPRAQNTSFVSELLASTQRPRQIALAPSCQHFPVSLISASDDCAVVCSDGTPRAAKEEKADRHSKKSVQQSLEAWPYRREYRGHNPAKKSVRTGAACSVGKIARDNNLVKRATLAEQQ